MIGHYGVVQPPYYAYAQAQFAVHEIRQGHTSSRLESAPVMTSQAEAYAVRVGARPDIQAIPPSINNRTIIYDGSRYLALDADGDGQKDIVEIYKTPQNHAHAATWKSTSTGFIRSGQPFYVGEWKNSTAPDARRYLAMDADGDHCSDIVEIYPFRSQRAVANIWRSYKGKGFVHTGIPSPLGRWTQVTAADSSRYLNMNVDNDTFHDIIEIYRSNDNQAKVNIWRNKEGRGFAPIDHPSSIGDWSSINASDSRRYYIADMTGDRQKDIVEIYKAKNQTYATIWRNQAGTGFIQNGFSSHLGAWSNVYSRNERRYFVVDLNQDGYADIVSLHRAGQRTHATIWENKNGLTLVQNHPSSDLGHWTDVYSSEEQRYFVMDTNGDKLTDIVAIHKAPNNQTKATVWANIDGRSFVRRGGSSSLGQWTNVYGPDERRYLLMDTNQDGQTDLVEVYKGESEHTMAAIWLNNQNYGFISAGRPSPLGLWRDIWRPRHQKP